MSATWHGYRRSRNSTTSGPDTTSLPSVLTSPIETPSRTAQYSATRVAVVPRPPPAAEAVHPRAERDVLVVERRPPERVDVDVRGGLGQGDLARRRPGRERLRAPRRTARRSTRGPAAGTRRPGTVPRQARLARLISSSSWKPLSQVPCEVLDGHAVAAADDAGRWAAAAADARRRHRRRRSAGSARPSAPRTSRGASPRPRIAVSHGVVVSAPVAGSAVTTARTRPARRPRSGPGRRRRVRTARRPAASRSRRRDPGRRPARCSRSAARAVTSPAGRCPGRPGGPRRRPSRRRSRAAWTWSIPVAGPRDDRRARRRWP